MNLRQLALVGLAALAVGGTAVAQTGPPTQPTPPPPPPPNGSAATPGTLIGPPVTTAPPLTIGSPSPAASATPAAGRRGGRRGSPGPSPAPSPSDTPEPPQFSTMDGVWEVQVQPLTSARTVYSHLIVTQKGDALSGTWIRENNQKVPFSGTFDGRLFKLTATDTKNTWTLAGYAENFSDMVGLVTTATPGDKGTPFTAAHRKKERLNDLGPGGSKPPNKPPY